MRVLFDHNLPHKLRISLAAPGQHEIVTTSYIGRRKSTALMFLSRATKASSTSRTLAGRRLAIVALSANNWPIIKDYVSRILSAIESAGPGSFQAVDCGRFTRKKPAAQ